MENPVKEIPGIIHLLTQSPPSIQHETITTYFTSTASFTHPFCRTGSWSHSRWLIGAIYRWYKIMSPRIDLDVGSVAFDEKNSILYVSLTQTFRIFFIPFYSARVHLTTVLNLQHNASDNKYYIHAQNDLYQVDQWIKFLLPGAWVLVYMWHFFATAMCVLGAAVGAPVSWMEERMGWGEGDDGALRRQRGMGRGKREWRWLDGEESFVDVKKE